MDRARLLLVLTVTIAVLFDRCAASVKITPSGGALTYSEGTSYTITCTLDVRIASDTHIEWLLNENAVYSDETRLLTRETNDEGKPVLKIKFQPYTRRNAGKYVCTERALNGNKVHSQDVIITTAEARRIAVNIKCDQTQYIRRGSTDYIRCSLQPPEAEVSYWSFQSFSSNSSRRIDRSSVRHRCMSNGTLEIRDVQLTDSGKYAVSASIKATGAANQAAVTVRVAEPPTISAPLNISSGTPIQGNHITIQCLVTGDPEPTIVWYKNQTQIQTSVRIKPLNNGRELFITSLNLSDGGNYYCVASNVIGNASSSFKLRVIVKPKIESFQSQTIRRDSMMKSNVFSCKVVASEGVEVQMWKGERLISMSSDGPRVMLTRHQVNRPDELVTVVLALHIDSARPEDTATYTCNASTAAGFVTETANLIVFHKPEIVNKQPVHECIKKEGMPCTVTCIALKGYKDVDIKWSKNGEDLVNVTDGNRVIITENNSNLTVKTSQLQLLVSIVRSEETFGSYRCTASNVYGNSTYSFVIREPLKPAVPNVSLAYITPTSVFFELRPPLNPIPHITYYTVKLIVISDITQNTERVSQQYDVVIEKFFGFRNLTVGKRYLIQIAAVGEAGSSFDVSTSPTAVEPRQPYPCEVVSPSFGRNKTTYIVRWRVPNDGGIRISEYKITYTVVETQNRQIPIGTTKEVRLQPTITLPDVSSAERIVLVNNTRFFEEEVYEQHMLVDLADATRYRMNIVAANALGASNDAVFFFSTYDDGTHAAALAAETRSSIIIAVIIIIAIALIIFDVMLHFLKQRGFTHQLLKNCHTSKSQPKELPFEYQEQGVPMLNHEHPADVDKRQIEVDDRRMLENEGNQEPGNRDECDGEDRRLENDNTNEKRTPKTKNKNPKRSVEWLDEQSTRRPDDEKRRDDLSNEQGDALVDNANSLPTKERDSITEISSVPSVLPLPPTLTRYEVLEEVDEAEAAAHDRQEAENVSLQTVATNAPFAGPRGSSNPNYSDATAPRSPAQVRSSATHHRSSSRSTLNGDSFPPPPDYLTQQYIPATYIMRPDLASAGYQFAPQPSVVKPRVAPSTTNHHPVDVELHRTPIAPYQRGPVNGDGDVEVNDRDYDPIMRSDVLSNGVRTNGVSKNGVALAPDQRNSAERKHRHAAAAYSPARSAPVPPPIASQPIAEPAAILSLPPPQIGIIHEYSF